MGADTAPALHHRRAGRSLQGATVVAAVWILLGASWHFVDAAPWMLAVIAVFTLPALWDLIRNPAAGMDIDTERLKWFSGRRHAEIALAEIERLRLDTRLDFSVRATLMLRSGAKVRLPFECTPPHARFEHVMTARSIPVDRFHFQLMQ